MVQPAEAAINYDWHPEEVQSVVWLENLSLELSLAKQLDV